MKLANEQQLTSCSLTCLVKDGVAEVSFPTNLQKDLKNTFCNIVSVQSYDNSNATYYVFCNVSYYSIHSQFYPNLLATFQNRATVYHFPTRNYSSLLVTPNVIQFYVKKRKDRTDEFELAHEFNGVLNICFFGYKV